MAFEINGFDNLFNQDLMGSVGHPNDYSNFQSVLNTNNKNNQSQPLSFGKPTVQSSVQMNREAPLRNEHGNPGNHMIFIPKSEIQNGFLGNDESFQMNPNPNIKNAYQLSEAEIEAKHREKLALSALKKQHQQIKELQNSLKKERNREIVMNEKYSKPENEKDQHYQILFDEIMRLRQKVQESENNQLELLSRPKEETMQEKIMKNVQSKSIMSSFPISKTGISQRRDLSSATMENPNENKSFWNIHKYEILIGILIFLVVITSCIGIFGLVQSSKVQKQFDDYIKNNEMNDFDEKSDIGVRTFRVPESQSVRTLRDSGIGVRTFRVPESQSVRTLRDFGAQSEGRMLRNSRPTFVQKQISKEWGYPEESYELQNKESPLRSTTDILIAPHRYKANGDSIWKTPKSFDRYESETFNSYPNAQPSLGWKNIEFSTPSSSDSNNESGHESIRERLSKLVADIENK